MRGFLRQKCCDTPNSVSNPAIVHFCSDDSDTPGDVTLPTPTVVTLTTVVKEIIAPLAELNERQVGELRELHAAMRQQAEELGRERGRREAAEQEVERLRRAQRSRPWWVRHFLA